MVKESQRVFIFSIMGPSVVDVFFERAFDSLRHIGLQLHGATAQHRTRPSLLPPPLLTAGRLRLRRRL